MAIISRFQEPRVRWAIRGAGVVVALYAVIVLALMWWWSYEPAQFDVGKAAQQRATAHQQQPVSGCGAVTGSRRCAVSRYWLLGCAELQRNRWPLESAPSNSETQQPQQPQQPNHPATPRDPETARPRDHETTVLRSLLP